MSQTNTQQRSNSKGFTPLGSASSSRAIGNRYVGQTGSNFRGSMNEGRIRDWQPPMDRGKGIGQNALTTSQSNKGVAGGQQANNSSTHNLHSNTSGSRSNLASKQPPTGIKSRFGNTHASQSPLKSGSYNYQPTFTSSLRDSKNNLSISKNRKHEFGNNSSSGANLFQMLDNYHKTRQGPQFVSQGKRQGSNIGFQSNQNSGMLKTGLRNNRNQRESTEQSKNREENSARKVSGVRTGNYNQVIQTPNSKQGPKGRGQMANSLINSETRLGQMPSSENIGSSLAKVNQGVKNQNNLQSDGKQLQETNNPVPNQMRPFDANFAASDVPEVREEEQEMSSTMQPVSEASSSNPMHTPESQKQSEHQNSISRSKGGQKQPRQSKSTINNANTNLRNSIVGVNSDQQNNNNQASLQQNYQNAEQASQHTQNQTNSVEPMMPGSFRSANNPSLEPTEAQAVSDGEAQSKPNSSLSNNTKLSLTRLDVPEVINHRKDFVSPQAKGDHNFDLDNATKLQASAQHRPNQQSYNLTLQSNIPRAGISPSKKVNLNQYGSTRGSSKLANFSKANQASHTTHPSLSPDKRSQINRSGLTNSISIKKTRRTNDQSIAVDNNSAVNKSINISASQSPSKLNNVPNYLKATATHQIYKKIVTNRQDQNLGRARTKEKLMSQKPVNSGDVRILDSVPAQNNFAPKAPGPAANFGVMIGGITAPDRYGIPMTPSKNNNFRASYNSGVSNKKQHSMKKIQNTNSNAYNQRGGHANSKVVTRAQRPQSKRLIDHSQPPAVKTHRTDKNEVSKNEEDSVTILNQSLMSESSKKLRPKQSDIAPEKFYKYQQDNIVDLINQNMKKSEVIESSLADREQNQANYHSSQTTKKNNFLHKPGKTKSLDKITTNIASPKQSKQHNLIQGLQDQLSPTKQGSLHKLQQVENSETEIILTQTDNLGMNQSVDQLLQSQNVSMPTQDVFVEDVFDEIPIPQIIHEADVPKTLDAVAVFGSNTNSPTQPPEHLPHFANEQIAEATSSDPTNIIYSKQVTNEELEVVLEEKEDISILDDKKFQNRPLKDQQNKIPTDTWRPMKKSQFAKNYSHVLTYFEKKELQNDDDGFECEEIIYYPGDIVNRAIGGTTKSKQECDDEEGYFIVKAGDQIFYRFEILKILGKGSFAQVVSCRDHKTGNNVAIKINRNTEIDHKFAKQEAKLLKFLMQEDNNDTHNIVRMERHIYFRDHQCFVFELLNTDLFEHLKDNGFAGFHEIQIQSYAFQLLQALIFLEKHKVIHCDMKPENILCVDQARMKLKVVDFGSGCFAHEQVYTYVQSRYYRAPEVILRIPYSEKVDIWSLGCILAELYTGEPLFPGNNEQEQLEYIMELQGIFPETMIDKSRKKDYYFDTDYSPFLIEHPQHGILRIPESRTLQDAVPSKDQLFLDFILHCLVLDPTERPGAAQAFQHPWVQQFAQYTQKQRDDLLSSVTDSRPGTQQTFKPAVREKSAEFTIDQEMKYFGKSEAEPHDFSETQSHDMQPQEQIYKQNTSQSQVSRQREQDGARASCCEISPERQEIYQQDNKTAYALDSHVVNQNNQNGTSTIIPEMHSKATPVDQLNQNLMQSQSTPTLPASPLKPSTESLLDHYNYEKHNKSNSISQALSNEKERQSNLSSLQKAKNSGYSATKVEEPKIISKTQAVKPVSSYTAQQSATKSVQKQQSMKKKK